MFSGASDMVMRSAKDAEAMYSAALLIFAAFAIAHTVGIMFPAKDGQSQQITRRVGVVCIAAILVLACWFLYAAHDAANVYSSSSFTQP